MSDYYDRLILEQVVLGNDKLDRIIQLLEAQQTVPVTFEAHCPHLHTTVDTGGNQTCNDCGERLYLFNTIFSSIETSP